MKIIWSVSLIYLEWSQQTTTNFFLCEFTAFLNRFIPNKETFKGKDSFLEKKSHYTKDPLTAVNHDSFKKIAF